MSRLAVVSRRQVAAVPDLGDADDVVVLVGADSASTSPFGRVVSVG